VLSGTLPEVVQPDVARAIGSLIGDASAGSPAPMSGSANRSEDPLLELTFEAQVIHWRGPSPYFFAPLPPCEAGEVRRISRAVTYGWGVIPVEAQVGAAAFTTSLFPKDDGYLLPLKDAVRKKADVTAGDTIAVTMIIRPPRR
jgi:hypothetical protein